VGWFWSEIEAWLTQHRDTRTRLLLRDLTERNKHAV
jgi:hypothetical protein